jgi:hypothetical protein
LREKEQSRARFSLVFATLVLGLLIFLILLADSRVFSEKQPANTNLQRMLLDYSGISRIDQPVATCFNLTSQNNTSYSNQLIVATTKANRSALDF